MTETELCPCGSSASFADCCSPVLAGERAPATAALLMRARYTAFAKGNVDFIMSSHDPETVETVKREEVQVWSQQSEWLGLDIIRTEAGEAEDETGTVDFIAKYRLQGLTTQHRERAQFRRVEGKWAFVDGGDIPVERKAKPASKWVAKKKKKK